MSKVSATVLERMEASLKESLSRRAEEIALELPAEQRKTILDFCNFHNQLMRTENQVEERISWWLYYHPRRKATHDRIGQETGLSRETISRHLHGALRNFKAGAHDVRIAGVIGSLRR